MTHCTIKDVHIIADTNARRVQYARVLEAVFSLVEKDPVACNKWFILVVHSCDQVVSFSSFPMRV